MMAHKFGKKKLQDEIKELEKQLKKERTMHSLWKKRAIQAQEELEKGMPQRLASEIEDVRIGCNDCGMRGLCTEKESKCLTKIICPECNGNNWTKMT